MKPPFNADDVIASRTFESDAGAVELHLHRPLAWPSDDVDREPDWVCWYAISFPNGDSRQAGIAGVDAIQALLLAFAAAKGDLDYVGDSTPTRRPELRWLGQTDLGLSINHFE